MKHVVNYDNDNNDADNDDDVFVNDDDDDDDDDDDRIFISPVYLWTKKEKLPNLHVRRSWIRLKPTTSVKSFRSPMFITSFFFPTYFK